LRGQTTLDAHAARSFVSPCPRAPGPVPSEAGRVRMCLYVCRQRSYLLWPPERGRASHACRSDKDLPLISSGIVAGPSRLSKPIGWPRKAGSTSSAPCSPLALWHFSTLCCALAAGIHVQASHLVEPAGRPAKESQRVKRKRYHAVLETTARSPGGSSALARHLEPPQTPAAVSIIIGLLPR